MHYVTDFSGPPTRMSVVINIPLYIPRRISSLVEFLRGLGFSDMITYFFNYPNKPNTSGCLPAVDPIVSSNTYILSGSPATASPSILEEQILVHPQACCPHIQLMRPAGLPFSRCSRNLSLLLHSHGPQCFL